MQLELIFVYYDLLSNNLLSNPQLMEHLYLLDRQKVKLRLHWFIICSAFL